MTNEYGFYEPDKIVEFDEIKKGDIIYFTECCYNRNYLYLVVGTSVKVKGKKSKRYIHCYETDNFKEEKLDYNKMIKNGWGFKLWKHLDI